MREQITAKRRELADAGGLANNSGLSVPRAELVERFRAMVDERAARFARVPPINGTLVTLPAGASSVTILEASDVPAGVYLVEAALLAVPSGVTLARHVLGVGREQRWRRSSTT
ncbi:MAG: hypothetical protein ACRD96_07250 [Bryobacteraceae bacterium]